jgi:alpha-beta hydrolase superfamily lysophospholipase
LRRRPRHCAKFALSGRPADMYGRTLAGARDVFFSAETPESLVCEAVTRFRPDSTRAILVDMVLHGLVKTDRIDTPLLVLGGKRDAIYQESDVRATAAAYGTEARLIPDVGHEMMLEPQWATVADHISSWLGERGL